MGGITCFLFSLAGKTPPFCPFPLRCPAAKLGKRIYQGKQKYDANMTSYESACQEDPELKAFDSKLHRRTSNFFTSFQGNKVNLSLDNLMQMWGFLRELYQDMVSIIISNNEDVWKNEEVKSLVDLYLESTSKTFTFFSNTVGSFVKEAQTRLRDLRFAIKIYETDSEFGGSMTNKYAKTLEELEKVTHMEDPFGDEFAKHYESLLKENEMILEKIGEVQVTFNKKQKNVKTLRKVVEATFRTAYVSSLILSIVPPHGHALVVAGVALGLPNGPPGTWVRKMMNKRDEALERQIRLLRSTEEYTNVNIRPMEKIKGLVDQMKLISQTVETGVQNREEEAMMQKLIKEVNEFDNQIMSVGETVASCSKCITEGKSLVQKLMISPRKS